jgi:hypothetical protein
MVQSLDGMTQNMLLGRRRRVRSGPSGGPGYQVGFRGMVDTWILKTSWICTAMAEVPDINPDCVITERRGKLCCETCSVVCDGKLFLETHVV